MLDSVTRKARQLAADKALRQWLWGCLLGRYRSVVTSQRDPPYLAGQTDIFPLQAEEPSRSFRELPAGSPANSLELPLAGQTLQLDPEDIEGLFARSFADVETLVSLHRFAWLPLLGDKVDSAWVAALWREWRLKFATPSDDWPWEAYTAAERVVNLIDYARRVGMPGPVPDTLSVLATHGPAIARRLEYFGEQGTSNHLAANGRGLYYLGLWLGLPRCAELGLTILLTEAEQLFGASGVLREESTHYHVLLTRQYASAWLTALAHRRPEANDLAAVVSRAAAVIPHFILPAGMPLIGDVSPDCPPEFLEGFLGRGRSGWFSLLAPAEQETLSALLASGQPADEDALLRDGWLRLDSNRWSGLWHGAPEGWSLASGHGHQDWGSFELHYAGEPLFIDTGRGAYGETGKAAYFRSAQAHNGLIVDSADPYPPNKPYYAAEFRRAVGGDAPRLVRLQDGVLTQSGAYKRLGIGPVTRQWTFADETLTIEDRAEGSGTHDVERLLHTPCTVVAENDGVVSLIGRGIKLRVSADSPIRIERSTRWTAYGRGEPITQLRIESSAPLPWSGKIVIAAS